MLQNYQDQYPSNWQSSPYPTQNAIRGGDVDRVIVALFKNFAVLNPAKTAKEGRPIYDDLEIVEIRIPGSKDVKVFPAHERSHWETDPNTGTQFQVTYAQRFHRQYRAFKSHEAQMMGGTPLAYAPFLTEARRSELRALNIYTVEALAHIDGQELKNLGQGGRELKNHAEQYLEDSKLRSHDTQVQAELEALRSRNQLLEEDAQRYKAIKSAEEERADLLERNARLELENDNERRLRATPFDDMSTEQLREYIRAKTGFPVQGNLINKRTLIRMAEQATQAAEQSREAS